MKRDTLMLGMVRLKDWAVLAVALLAMAGLFASSQADFSSQRWSYPSVNAYHGSRMSTGGLTSSYRSTDASCTSTCAVHAVALSMLPLAPELSERGLNCIEPSSRLDGQLPMPGRHPPRSAA